jgi:peptide/nickel transport system permease protein
MTEVIAMPVSRPQLRRVSPAWSSWPISLRLGTGLLTFYVFVAVLATFWTPYDANRPGAGAPLSSPSLAHPFGTDRLGSDVLSHTMAATALDLWITVVAVGIAAVIGSIIGPIVQSFPGLLLAMLIVQAVGAGTTNVIIVLAVIGIPTYVRLARAELMSKRTLQYADAARLAGRRPLGVAFGHLLPNSLGPLIANTSINASWVVLVTASLGFLGVGIEPGVPEWGSLIARGQDAVMAGQWWIALFPGLAVVGLSAAFYLIGDGISDFYNPRRNG